METPVGTEGSNFRELQIVNVVASGVLGTGEIDTDVVGAELSIEKTVMPGRVYLKPEEMPPVSMVFRSGSYTIAGASSWKSVLEAVDWLYETLDDIGVDVSREKMFASASVKYLVVTGDLNTKLNLSAVVVGLGMENSEYEPEQFPAVIHSPENTDCTVLLFSTGKVTITGVGNVRKAYEVYGGIEETIKKEMLMQ
jgi:transcription initiation factor TFIID TATA-box-binding protein